MIDKNIIYSYFQTDDFPTEEQFRATWDSFWHKSESIPMNAISGLNQMFQQTVTVGQIDGKANTDASNINISAFQDKLGINAISQAIQTETTNRESADALKLDKPQPPNNTNQYVIRSLIKNESRPK